MIEKVSKGESEEQSRVKSRQRKEKLENAAKPSSKYVTPRDRCKSITLFDEFLQEEAPNRASWLYTIVASVYMNYLLNQHSHWQLHFPCPDTLSIVLPSIYTWRWPRESS